MPGIEVRPEPVRQTDVRYYKAADAPKANEIVEVLRSMNEAVGPAKYLKRYEYSANVRSNQYEVWLAAPGEP